MNTATLLRRLPEWDSDAALYRLSPPLVARGESHEFVIVSTQQPREGEERNGTLVFVADALGRVGDWTDISRTHAHSHIEALAELGYEVARCPA